MWDENTYSFWNFNGHTVEVWEWKNNFIPLFIIHPTLYDGYQYLSLLGVKLIHVNKSGHWNFAADILKSNKMHFCGEIVSIFIQI